ncbi:cytochrome c [Phenylobacterium sp.]|uniref:c-type cytochrome n=1 Tax=Phenylobacterium sp. TaxID=1871053 RepID=UPI00121D90F3|nr:cytochrome c [Phenylobacterium sp.]THD61412.1 MAG: cytochrome c [Phenylobacterium sp.]
MGPRLGLLLRWGLPWATMGLAVAVFGLGVVATGAYDTTATTPHPALVAWATHATMVQSVRREAASLPPPRRFTAADVAAGARLYDANCVACHGAPGVARAAWTDGLTPNPPYLLDAGRQFTPNELYWIVRHGVKMTAMPSWEQTMSQSDVWTIVAFLSALPEMSAADYARERGASPQGATP